MVTCLACHISHARIIKIMQVPLLTPGRQLPAPRGFIAAREKGDRREDKNG